MSREAEAGILEGANVMADDPAASGGSYVAFDGSAGGSVAWTISAVAAGTYDLTLRYAAHQGAEPLTLEVNGETEIESLRFDVAAGWAAIVRRITLEAGVNTVRLVAANGCGPDIDSFDIEPVSIRRINFQPASALTPAGYEADVGLAYDTARGYGWIVASSAGTSQSTPLDVSGLARDRNTPGVEQRLDTHINMAPTDAIPAAWEIALKNGTYAVTVAAGDSAVTSGFLRINAEGQTLIPTVSPTTTRPFAVGTALVTVTDGRLTLDGAGGVQPRINYVDIERVFPGQPTFADVVDSTGLLLDRKLDVPVDTSFSVTLDVQLPSDVLLDSSVNLDTVSLYRTADGVALPGVVNTSAGRDTINFSVLAPLEYDTQYTLRIAGVRDLDGEIYAPITRTFTTARAPEGPDPDPVAFTRNEVSAGDPVTSLLASPDGMRLYAATLNGLILRWDIDQTTGELSNRQSWDGLQGSPFAPRAIIGIAFDPTDPNRLWVSHNDTLFVDPAQDFTGRISYLDIGATSVFTATATTYVTGLPRSIRDHLSNSLAFGPDGALYLNQGSNTAMGAPDSAWGFRSEQLLSAAVLRIETGRTPPSGGHDVRTLREDGGVPYDPYAPGSVVKLFATGVRNAYDLVWHSNGRLYVPTNGSAAGGNTPDDPTTLVDEALDGGPTQPDYLFDVVQGGYYGHPNALRGEYIMNGGNPTALADPGEVVVSGGIREGYPVGVLPDPDWLGFAWSFGTGRSPNGVIEYRSDAFGGAIRGALLVNEFSGGDRVLGLRLDDAGRVTGSFTAASGLRNPLDLTEHRPSGRIYVAEYGSQGNLDDDVVTLLTPRLPGRAAPLRVDRFEAEEAALDGFSADGAIPGASGGSYALFAPTPPPTSQTITLWVGGQGGPTVGPRFDLLVDGVRIAQAEVSDPQSRAERLADGVRYTPMSFVYGSNVPIGRIDIVYTNDGPDLATLEDRNLYVDRIAIGDRVFQSESQGYFTPLRPVAGREGPREDLNWAGTLTFLTPPVTPVVTSQTVTIRAAGSGAPGAAPRFAVKADGLVIGEGLIANPQSGLDWRTNGLAYRDYVFSHQAAGPARRIEIVYLNDATDPVSGENLNLFVDRVDFGGRRYEAETSGFFLPSNPQPGRAGPRQELLWGGALGFDGVGSSGSAEWLVDAEQAGARQLRWRYALPDGEPVTVDLVVNGRVQRAATLTSEGLGDGGGGWGFADVTVLLQAGANSIEIAPRPGPRLAIDFIEIAGPMPDAGAVLEATVLNGLPGADRLVLIEHQTALASFPTAADQQEGVVRLANVGDAPLTIAAITLPAPFALVDPSQATMSIAPGAVANVAVRFDADPPGDGRSRTIHEAAMEIVSNAGSARIDLHGIWLSQPSRANEPTVAEIFDAMGWTNEAEGYVVAASELNNGGVVRLARGEASVMVNGTEAPAFYFERADVTKPVTVLQIGSFQGLGTGATFEAYSYSYTPSLGSLVERAAYRNQTLIGRFTTDGRDGQTFFPREAIVGGPADLSFSVDRPIAFRPERQWTDPYRRSDAAHSARMMEIYEDGERIENAYVLLMDFGGAGADYDFNDNIYLLTNLRPFDGLDAAL